MKMSGSNRQLESMFRDKKLMEEIKERAATGRLRGAALMGVSPETVQMTLEGRPVGTLPAPGTLAAEGVPHAPGTVPLPPVPVDFATEAIVLEYGRPSLLVRNGSFELPESPTWRHDLALHRTNIEAAIARVGRVELLNHLTYDWVGTCWVVAPNVVITNRHVAEEFVARGAGGTLTFATNVLGQQVGARIDLRAEHQSPDAVEVPVRRILYMAEPGAAYPDIALLELEPSSLLPDPLPLSAREVVDEQLIGVVGYPAYDSRNGLDAIRRYFGDVFDVKRFAPGRVSHPAADHHYFIHDCTTLGGNSGSKVFDLATGEVVGLHFQGLWRSGNFAVKARHIKEALARASVSVAVPGLHTGHAVSEAIADGRHGEIYFKNRDGYQSAFLGSGDRAVPLPALGAWEADAVPVSDGSSEGAYVARYRHFSVVVSKSRRLSVYTAVNIDGREARRIPRQSDAWYIDDRLDEDYQTGNELYRGNDLDRGHMVRRLDPVWGPPDVAAEANEDTFHYVNSCPQHKDLNQREWNELEDYILDNSDAKDFKVSVFTGPVLRNTDRIYREVGLPREYWKIAVMVNSDTGKLSATGYILGQDDMIADLEEAAFTFGRFKTYQVPISEIESRTGLDFGRLRTYDPLAAPEGMEAAPRRRIHVRSARDIRFVGPGL